MISVNNLAYKVGNDHIDRYRSEGKYHLWHGLVSFRQNLDNAYTLTHHCAVRKRTYDKV